MNSFKPLHSSAISFWILIVISITELSANNLSSLNYPKNDALCAQSNHNKIFNKKQLAFSSFKIKPNNLLDFEKKLSAAEEEKIRKNIENLPLTFRKNSGQFNDDIMYQALSLGWQARVSFMRNELSFGFSRETEIKNTNNHKLVESKLEMLIWNQEFVGANKDVRVEGYGEAASNCNYFIGNDARKYVVNASDYKMLSYENIYPNIDFHYYTANKNLKYDYVIKPGGKINSIKIKNKGVKSITINKNGELEINTTWGTLIEKLPESYQLINGVKKNVSVVYTLLSENIYGFKVNGAYDQMQALIIDPINYIWGTFVGGTVSGDVGYLSGIAIDADKNVYASGQCTNNFPTTPGVYDNSHNGSVIGYSDAFVIKLSANGSTLVYSTYIGGNADDRGIGIAASKMGEVFVCGRTQSADFPTTTSAIQTAKVGNQTSLDAFILKLNANGTALIYSSYLGGSNNDEAFEVKIDNTENAYLTGGTNSNGKLGGVAFPTTAGAFDTTMDKKDAFITCINPTGTALVFSTFVGGNDALVNNSIAFDITLSSSGEIYITGSTNGTETSSNAYQTSFGGGIGTDVFVAKFNNNCSSRIYNTYIGGTAFDEAYGIDVNTAGEAFVVGMSNFGSDFPTTPGVFDTIPNSTTKGFITKLNVNGTDLIYSTYLLTSKIYSVKVNLNDDVYVTGEIQSIIELFPGTFCAFDQSENGKQDFFIAKMNANGNELLYLSYFGGSQDDYGNGPVTFGKMAMLLTGDCKDQIYVGGTTHSLQMPTTSGAYQPNRVIAGGDQPFIFHLKPEVNINFSFSATPTCSVPIQFINQSNASCAWDSAWASNNRKWYFGDGGTSTLENPIHTYNSAGTYSVKLKMTCPLDSIIKTINVTQLGCQPCAINADTASKKPSCFNYNNGEAYIKAIGGSGNYSYSWSIPSNINNDTIKGLAPGLYTVTVSDGFCSKITAVSITANTNITPKPTITNNGNQLVSSVTNGNQWYLDGDIIPGETGNTFTPTQNGSYTVTSTAAGCASAFSDPFILINVGVNETSASSMFEVYPNPSNGITTLEIRNLPTNENISVLSIFNLLGEIVQQHQIKTTQKTHITNIDLTGYPTGCYWLKLSSTNTYTVKKIIVK